MTEGTENTGTKQKRGRFQKGQSGNPAGKPKGARHATTLAMQALLDGEADNLTRKAVEMALTGDGAAMRLCMDRLLPVRKDRPIVFDLPKLETAGDVVKASAALVDAAAAGQITPSEAGEFSKLVEGHFNILKADELQKRLEALEAAVGTRQ
jgi:Family of unknown function (DUF5681)